MEHRNYSLPADVISGIFDQLAFVYGNEWRGKWTGMKRNDVEREWAARLGGLRDSQIAHVMANLPARAPNMQEFLRIAHDAPREEPAHSGGDDPLHGRRMFLVTIGKNAWTVASKSMEDVTAWAQNRAGGAAVRIRALRDDESPGLARAEEYDRLRGAASLQSAPQQAAPKPAHVSAQQFDDAEGLPW